MGIEGQFEAADDCGLEEGTARRCRGAVRRLHRARADFISLSITDSDHISGGRGRSTQPPALTRGTQGLPSCQGTGAGLAPPGRAPHHTPARWTRGLPVGQESPQTGLLSPLLCREAAANLPANHSGISKGSRETLLFLPSPSTLPRAAPHLTAGAAPALQSLPWQGSPACAPQGDPSSKSLQVIAL